MSFRCVPQHNGAVIEFEQRGLLGKKTVPYGQWGDTASGSASSFRFISHAVAAGELVPSGNGVFATPEFILSLSASQVELLGIPKQIGLSVTVSMRGRIDSSDSILLLSWQDQNSRAIAPDFQGPFLRVGGEWGRLSRPLYEIHIAARDYNNTSGKPFSERLPLWQQVQEALQKYLGDEVQADKFVGSLTIYQAGAFGLDVRETSHGPHFLPILMARLAEPEFGEVDDGNDAPETDGDDAAAWTSSAEKRSNDADALLPPQLQDEFHQRALSRPGRTDAAYVIARNTYLLVDPALRTALDVVKQLRGASVEERKAFLKNPRTRIASALGEDGDALAASLFVETVQYSDRIEGLGLWEKPSLPWISRKSNHWLPEEFVVKIGSKTINATPEKIEELHVLCDQAEQDGSDLVNFEDEPYRTSDVRTTLTHLGEEGVSYSGGAQDKGQPLPAANHDVLIIKENLEGLDYHSRLAKRGNLIPLTFPAQSINGTVPKEHQLQGFEWLCNCWKEGWPGALLADDMGLGKTFQGLAFLAWIKDNMAARRGMYRPLQGPFLIVAPTSLLDNWKKEASIHLKSGKLGSCAEAFGPGLKTLKRPKSAGWTEEDALDVDYIRQVDWILTTYETLALYHRSFARIAYSVAIFDEMQKVKSPDSINSHTAKTMNIDFVLGMTGTPIENRLEDLWCIMDRVAPGYLGDLKSFSNLYGDEDPSALTELKAKMDRPQGGAPAIMLRRMKDDVAKDLPDKHIATYPVTMPSAQARAYDDAVAIAKAGSKTRKSMLETLHRLRGISLHPERGDDTNAYDPTWRASWINSSARLQKTVALLEDIRRRSEKALVFLEDRAMQRTFAAAISEHFGLAVRPQIINGAMAGRQRQEVVDTFQQAPAGFDLLILSPKAAGIGLTITAANHVIHLSRWWNPAVEDQCNDRAFRIGQTKDVTIHLPMAIHPVHQDGSFDQRLHDLLERKRSLSRDMLAPPTSDRDVDGLFAEVVG
ncbi:DEAD/DEAH box helicase [Rhizobium sp. YTUHZ045]|uniref:DEAD/DEAH box helicase n=1 Tax=Rhizobium sp. YTUHZ045 TaxID=2962888 RepID=UPI003DA8F427